jgi:tetratricopeptide (TPR) repeat protein
MRPLLVVLFAVSTLAQDVYVPPVPIGIKRDGLQRSMKSPIAFPDERVPWIRIRSAHYDVLSNAPEEQTRDLVRDLETLASILTKTSTRFTNAPVTTTVLVFANRKESQPYFELLLQRDDPSIMGLYVRHSGGGTMFIDASRRKAPIEKTVMHELVHDLLRQSERPAPMWIEEGLAEYFANGEIRGGKIIAGRPVRAHLSVLRRQGEHIALEDLFRVQAETSMALLPQFYAQSWAAVDWLMGMDHERFFAFLDEVERGKSVADALHTHYGKTLRDMEKPIHGAIKTLPVEFAGSVIDIPSPTAAERPALLFELGRFLSYVAGAQTESQRHYAEVLRLDPKHARTLAAVGRFEEALAAGLNDPDVHLMYAESLLTTALGPFAGTFEPAEGDTEKYRRARKLAEHALAIGAHEGASRAAIGATYFVESDLAPGIEHLERAHELLPQRKDIVLNLYAMLLRTQQLDKAEALHTKVFTNVEDKQLVFAVKNIRVTAETSRASALAKAGKLDEAATIVRNLAAATDDPMGRRELEQHAATLESIAIVNRHITMYNDAIALANKGKNRDALKLLDELLTIAKDERVLEDAQKFRAGTLPGGRCGHKPSRASATIAVCAGATR